MGWTTHSVARFQWKGDHNAVEDWAEEILTRHQGKRPDRAVFMGDCRGVYVDPQRAAELGIPSRYSAPVLVEYGMWIEWNGLEFVVADATDDGEVTQLADKLAALDDADGHDWTYDEQARYLLTSERPAHRLPAGGAR